ncbi:unnamed protein product [Lymnaea stagnalis]|uniref:UvrD-like helicase ATP-binding domain-containing protein n=1 Tax=Lymnaea stagnalis TaxID=6523 RepID=A0AAV2HH73_LYMST
MDVNMEDDASKVLAECTNLKKHGNRCYRSYDYQGAIGAYTKGIQSLEIYMAKNEGKIQIRKWDKILAQLHGNRSECWFKLSKHRQCLEDAKTSVSYHSEWYKGHFRVARAFRDLGKFRKSVYAFVQAYIRVASSEAEDLKKKVLYELIETAFVIASQLDSLLTELRNIPATLQEHVINFYLENKAWDIVEFIVTKVWKLTDSDLWRPRSSSTSKWDVDLKHFCDKDLLSQQWWVCKVLHHFLVLKSDHHQLKFHPGDTYFHATISIVVQSNTQRQETLELVGVDNVHDNPDVDHDGDSNADAKELLHYVVEKIVIPNGDLNIQDDKGNTVLHHLATYETYPISVLSYILSKEADYFKINKEGKTALDLTSQSDKRNLLRGKVVAQLVTETDKHNKIRVPEEKKKLKAKNIKVLSSLLSWHIIPVIPNELVKISADSCKDLLTSLADAGKWLVLKELVIQFKQGKGKTSMPTFAKEMSLTRVVEAPAQELTESDKIDVVRLLVSHEACVDSPGAIEASIRNEEWKLTMELLDLGLNPDEVTLTPGDTPYHAALHLALNKLQGDFSMLEKLKEIHDQKKSLKKDVTATDKDGNTLLHMAAQATSNPHSLKAVQLLLKWQIPTGIENKRKKMAVDYLQDCVDERRQLIQVPTGSKSIEEATSKTNTGATPSEEKKLRKKILTHLSKIPEANVFLNPAHVEIQFVQPGLLDSDDDDDKEKINSLENGLGNSDINGLTREELTQDDIDELSKIDQMEIDPRDFDSLEWDIECTESVWRTLISKRQATVDIGSQKLPLRNLVLMKLKQLGSGDWKNLKQRSRRDVPETLKLYCLALTSGAFILWERAVAFSPRLSDPQETSRSHDSQESAIREGRVYAEHVRLWEIGLKKSDLQPAVAKVVKSHHRGQQCVVKKYLLSQKPVKLQKSERLLPKLFSECTDLQELDEVQRAQVIQLTPPASLHDNEFTILKLYTLSSQMVEAVLNDGESKVDFPFRVTEIEHTFIHLKPEAPLLLLGRSGTGKTTCCLYRLFNEFLNYWELAKDLGRPHIECLSITDEAKINGPEVPIQESDGNVGQNNEDTHDESDNNCEHLHQIFVTKNSVLCQEVEKNFVKLCQTPKWLCDHVAQRAEDIPNRLQDMEDNSFPLFLTSRHFLLILDASVDGQAFFSRDEDFGMKLYIPGWEPQEDIFNIGQPLHRVRSRRFQHAGRAERRPEGRRESTYEVFAHEIWPKIKKESKFHPSLVWTEIVSFIKGSYEALECSEGYLNKEQYISIGRKRAPNFDGDRPLIYEIFQRYQNYLKKNHLFDEADVVFHIYGRLKKTPGNIYWMPHHIYIDETQDFSQAELALLVSLCRFPNQMFLAGDTAQSIMKGISFRFADLKSIFFHRTHQTLVGQSQVKKPDTIRQLRHNYRSHSGILALASAVLDIIMELFPETIDKLEKDQGMFDGPKPVIIETCKPEDLAHLLKGNTRDTTPIEFGAHQAILVVDDEAKNKLPPQLRDGIVLTIYESKGLEFDDILIYNFFKHSQASKEWRVVISFLNELEKTVNKSKSCENSSESLVVLNQDVLQQAGRPRALTFEKHLHKLLETELKQIYTAVTRARVNVWIFDEDAEKRAPMFEYFKALNLVKILGGEDTGNNDKGKGFMEASTPMQWKKAGDKHMKKKKYEVAATCYKKANQKRLEKLAKAFMTSREAARETNTSAKKNTYTKAGAQFLYCKAMEHAVGCFKHAQEYKLAAITLKKLGQFEDASNQYKLVHDLDSAISCLEKIGQYRQAIQLRVDSKQFSEALECLHRYQNLVKTFEANGQAIPESLLKNKPRKEDSEDNLRVSLAEHQHSQGKREDCLKTMAKVTDKKKKIIFFKYFIFWKEAAELLHDGGNEEERKEAVHLMMKSGQLDTALMYAKKGFFKPLRAAIHISMAMGSDNDQKVKENLKAAKDIYGELKDRCGLALAALLLGKHTKDEKQLKEAYKLFDDPVSPHLPGRLESFASIVELFNNNKILLSPEDCSLFIKTLISSGLKFIQILTDKTKQWQHYMDFYGLELDETNKKVQKLKWYPCTHPLFKKIQKCDGNAKCYIVEVDVKTAAKVLTKYTLECLKKMTESVRKCLLQLTEQTAQKITCKNFHEELKCDQAFCKNQHNWDSMSDSDRAAVLNLLILNVELDNKLFQAAEAIEMCGMADMKAIFPQEISWESVDRLLEFLAPSRPYPNTDMEQVLKLVATIGNSKKTLAQIERYFRLPLVDPNNQIEPRLLVESTCLVTKAVFWTSLLHLNINVQRDITRFENQISHKLTNKNPENLSSLGLYLSEAKPGVQQQIHFAGSSFMQSFNEIRCSGDMHRSTNLFIEMMNFVGQCGHGMMLPPADLEYIIFWMEFHFCASIFTLANHQVHQKQTFYLPNSLLVRVNLVNACKKQMAPNQSDMTVQQIVLRQELKSVDVIMDTQTQLINILLGTENSSFSLIHYVEGLCKGNSAENLLAERILILTLVTLLNIPNNYVHEKFECCIRKELYKLEFKSLPQHLQNLISEAKKSKSYTEVARSLQLFFNIQKHNDLKYCMWHGQGKNPLGLEQLDLSKFPDKPFSDHDIAQMVKDEKQPEAPQQPAALQQQPMQKQAMQKQDMQQKPMQQQPKQQQPKQQQPKQQQPKQQQPKQQKPKQKQQPTQTFYSQPREN